MPRRSSLLVALAALIASGGMAPPLAAQPAPAALLPSLPPEGLAELQRRAGRTLDAARQIGRVGADIPEIEAIVANEARGLGGARAAEALARRDFEAARSLLERQATELLEAADRLAGTAPLAERLRALEILGERLRGIIDADGPSVQVAPVLAPGEALAASLNDPAVALLQHRTGRICTGSYVGAGWVLTAAHCVCPTSAATSEACAKAEPSLRVPAEWHVFFQHAGRFAVEQVEVAPDYAWPVEMGGRWRPLSDDVAMLRLRRAPNWIMPMPLDAGTPPTLSGATIVGYGYAGGARNPWTAAAPGLKTSGPAQVQACPAGAAEYLSPAAHLCHSFVAGQSGTICHGDSGGPLLAARSGAMRVLGIASLNNRAGAAPSNPALGTACGHVGSVGVHSWAGAGSVRDFVEARLAAGPPLPPLPAAFPPTGRPPATAILGEANGRPLVPAGQRQGRKEVELRLPGRADAQILLTANAEGPLTALRLVARRPGQRGRDTLLCEARPEGEARTLSCVARREIPPQHSLHAIVEGRPRPPPSRPDRPQMEAQETRMQLLALALPDGHNAE
jgi:hypothetical protein